jgi:hypothetical protein
MMAAFQPVDVKKYLRKPEKPLDKIDRKGGEDYSVNSVKPVLEEPADETSRASEDEGRSFTTVAATPSLGKGVPESVTREVNQPSHNQRASNVYLPAVLLENLMAWVVKYHELRVEHPNGLILNAQPHHVRDVHEKHDWGVVYNPERHLLLSWGDVPEDALVGLHNLDTGELLIPETVTM